MSQDRTIGSDKYFHCVANCQSSRAAGKFAACAVASSREDVMGRNLTVPVNEQNIKDILTAGNELIRHGCGCN